MSTYLEGIKLIDEAILLIREYEDKLSKYEKYTLVNDFDNSIIFGSNNSDNFFTNNESNEEKSSLELEKLRKPLNP
ncbi:3266_t:CDS:2 [Funneliformis geosporum]|uniref:13491_t:CDS:1 n=1 Tax=Funneliformis geosporum TaxID=1117311 RepID=A0A9W4SVB0_9GLOM|nr:3266_t:CDS:2 [Funneliformis geosporum]CAI2182869.1 13491_t:CDS:2 [Funneliformis geosporum]